METIDVHGMKEHIEGESDSAKYGAHYLSKLGSDEAKIFFDAARRNTSEGTSHFETPHDEHSYITHHLTLAHNDDGTFTLRKRAGY